MGQSLNITLASTCDKEKWDRYVLHHPKGIAYQLFAWKEAVETAYGFKGAYLIAQRSSQVKGILPLIHIHPPLLPGSMVSLPYCDAGGPLADSCDIEKELVLKALKLTRNSGIKTLSVRSADQFADIDAHRTVNPNKARMILALPDRSDTLLSSLKAKVRSQARKPVRDGLTVQQGGQELLHDFYPLFLENMRDLGSPVHSKKWIQSILQAYKNRSHLFIVRMPDNTPAAGGVLLCHPNTVSVPWASSLRRFNRWNPNMLLYWGFLKFAADNGYVSFDFGRSTPGEGTFRFKKQWGATPLYLHWAEFRPCHCQYNLLTPHAKQNKTDGSEARKLAESIVMKMPVPLFQGLGNITRKYIPL